MKKLALASLSALALAAAGCGSDTKSCTSRAAELAATSRVPAGCTAQAGTVARIPVNLCAKCSDSSPSCQAEFIAGQVEIAPAFQECSEDVGCPQDRACELTNNRVNCEVAIPAGTAPGAYPIVADVGAVGTLTVGSSSGCSFSLASFDGEQP